jgi:hypothetical protein
LETAVAANLGGQATGLGNCCAAMVTQNGAILTGFGTLVCAEPQLKRSWHTSFPFGSNSRLGVGKTLETFAPRRLHRCATYLIKGQVGRLAWQRQGLKVLLRQIAPCLSSRRLWALWRQFVRKRSDHPLVFTVSNSRRGRVCTRPWRAGPSGLKCVSAP